VTRRCTALTVRLLVLALVVGATACGGDDADPLHERGPARVAGGDLETALLTSEELGDGWLQLEDDSVDIPVFARPEYKPWCERRTPLRMPVPTHEERAVFEDPAARIVLSAVGEFAPGEAGEWMAATIAELARCEEEGPGTGPRIEAEPIDDLGDEAVSVSLSAKDHLGPWTLDVALVRVGDRIGFAGEQAETGAGLDEDDLVREMATGL
jgi:hypothetical protein